MKLPVYKYNPNPVNLQVIEHELTICPVCNEQRELVYVGPFYSIEEVEGICPWCIADGSAAKKYDGEFQDAASCEEVSDNKMMEELIYRTPGFFGWQQEQWLACCGDFCAIKDYISWEQIKQLVKEYPEETKRDIQQLFNEYGITNKEFETGSYDYIQGYLFECLHCKRPRFYTDCD